MNDHAAELDKQTVESVLAGNHHTKRGRWARKIIWIALLVAVAVLVGWWFLGTRSTDGPTFSTVEVYQGNLTVTIKATGTLEPTVQVDVGSELSGIIETIEVDYNEHVTAGQVLARLDTDQLEARVLQSEAALQSAEAQLLQAKTSRTETQQQLTRAEGLIKDDYVSAHDLEAAQAAFDRAEASVASASAQVAMAVANLEADRTVLRKAVIVSPIDGIVLARHVEPGQTVAAALQAPVLFTLAEDLAAMELRVDIDEADIGQVSEGQSGSFTVDAYPNQIFPAEITSLHLAPKSVNGVVTYEAVLAVSNEALLLRPGMTAAVNVIVYESTDALLVPNAALRFSPPGPGSASVETRLGYTQVWAIGGDDPRPTPLAVALGRSDSRATEVFSTELEPGMTLVTASNVARERKGDPGFSLFPRRSGRG